jgi:hypothetical protein
MDNGDMLHREYYDSEESTIRALEEYVEDAEKYGWECEWLGLDGYRAVCSKCEEDEEFGRVCYQRELGVEPA